MKGKRFFICLVLLISSIMVSCSWQLPEKVSVKTNADYNFSAGNLNMPLDEYLDIKKIMEKGTLPENVKVYDYFPGQKDSNTQRYLLKVKLAEIPLDLDSIMAKINLEENLKAMEFNKDIKVPNIKPGAMTKAIEGLQNISVPAGSGGIDKDINGIQFSLPDFLNGTGIEKCIVANGALNVAISGLNSDADYTVTLNSTGGLEVLNKSATKAAPAIDLANAAINPSASNITVSISFTNLKSVNNPKITITPVINKLESVTVDLGTNVQTNFTKTVDLGTDITDKIAGITLDKSGFKVTYTNTLPAGNNVSLTAKSDFLGLAETKKTFDGGSVNKTVEFMSGGKVIDDLATNNTVDFSAKIALPGQSGADKKITVTNVDMGQTYKLGMKMEPVLKWTEVKVKTSGLTGFNKAGTVDLGLDLNKMFTDFGTKMGNKDLFKGLKIDKLPVYIFCGKPQGVDAFNDLQFNAAKAKLYLQPEGSGPKTELGDLLPADNPNIKFVDNVPKLDDKAVVVTDDLSTLPNSATSDLAGLFTDMISKPGKLGLDYDVNVTGKTSGDTIIIKESQMKGAANIALEAYIDLGLALTVPKGGIAIDLAKLDTFKDLIKKDGKDRDILNGAGKSIKDQGTDKYLTAVKNVSVRCDVGALPFATETPITFNMKSNVGDWNLNLGQGQALSIDLTSSQVEKLFNEPTNPDCEFKITQMKVTLPEGAFSMPRGKKVDTNLYLNLATDGTISVWEKGQNNGGNK